MRFSEGHYHHLYNRSNNKERLFKERENYRYFFGRFHQRFNALLDVVAYCLMPTHFHLLVHVPNHDSDGLPESDFLSKQVGIWLSAYTKAVNRRYGRNGCLFQRRTKLKPVLEDGQLLALVSYIHQNPVRAGLVHRPEDWEFSSYGDYIGLRNDPAIRKEIVLGRFRDVREFAEFSSARIIEKDPLGSGGK